MGDVTLFRVGEDSGVSEIQGRPTPRERDLQDLVQENLDSLLGVRFLRDEYPISTGKSNRRADTLGIDNDGCPVIIEYKQTADDKVIAQCQAYSTALRNNRNEFRLLVKDKFGESEASRLDWSGIRIICVANKFSGEYLEEAAEGAEGIELIRYKRYDHGLDNPLLLFEFLNTKTTQKRTKGPPPDVDPAPANQQDWLEPQELARRLGDDVEVVPRKFYFALKRNKSIFASVLVRKQARKLIVFVKIDPDTVECEKGFTRDVRSIGHYGTGDLEITIRNSEDFEKAQRLIVRSYPANFPEPASADQRSRLDILTRLDILSKFLFGLGDDVQEKKLKSCIAFKRRRNFASILVRNRIGVILIYVNINPDTVECEKGFTRDVRSIGHYGTGDLEITIRSDEDIERAKRLIEQSYEMS